MTVLPMINPVHSWIAKSAEDAMQRVLESDLHTQLAQLYYELAVCGVTTRSTHCGDLKRLSKLYELQICREKCSMQHHSSSSGSSDLS